MRGPVPPAAVPAPESVLAKVTGPTDLTGLARPGRGPTTWGCPWRLPAASRARGQGRVTAGRPGSPQVAGRRAGGPTRAGRGAVDAPGWADPLRRACCVRGEGGGAPLWALVSVRSPRFPRLLRARLRRDQQRVQSWPQVSRPPWGSHRRRFPRETGSHRRRFPPETCGGRPFPRTLLVP